MNTGENEQGLRKILDMTRLISIVLLAIHFYYYCQTAFQTWQLTALITDRIFSNIRNTGLFNNFHKSKLIAMGLLFISLLGAKGRKDKKNKLYNILFLYYNRFYIFLFQLSFAVHKIATSNSYSPLHRCYRWRLHLNAYRRNIAISCNPIQAK